MKSSSKLLFVIFIIIISITSVYPLNSITEKKIKLKEEKNSFWEKHDLNWKNTIRFNINPYWNQEELTFFNDRTVTISNKKIATSKDDSFQDNKGNNKPTSYESGNIRWKGFRFQNLNIPANATITNVELTLTGYKHGNTTVIVKAENLKSPTSYSSDKNYLSSRSTTSKSINWSIPNLYNGIQLKSPNLKGVVQEVVNNKGGITHLSLIISSSKKWEGWNYDDGSSSYYPKISISYSISTPEVSDDKHTMNENTAATIAVFDNDENVPSNGSIKISTSPKNGTAIITDPNNTASNPSDDIITYTPNQNFDGTDTFKYQVCDGSNNCDTASVNITINSVVDPCDAALSGNLDTDNDGVADICDLDDDNDGILDTDECPTVNPFSFQLNANNKKFTNSGTIGDVGDVMLYRNVGKKDNQNIDLKVTVTANSDPQNMTIDISGFKFGSDLYPVLLGGKNEKETPSATVKFEFLKSGTNQLINVAPSFMFKDVDFLNDGTGESVEINKNLISSYSLSKNPATSLYVVDNITKNYVGTSGNFLRVNSKKEAGGLNNEDMWIGLQLLEVNSFNINFLKRTGNTGYVFESDTFSKSANTVQLDADCSIDTDADGIPDYLDTDSDNDGCPDATEGDKNMTTTATLANGSNGGSSANLGTKSNKNGIPIPFGTTNGSETIGQNNTDATKSAEKITINTTTFSITQDKHKIATLIIDASAIKTNTFANGVPNYNTPNGTDTSNSLIYAWYKKSDLTKKLSTKKSLPIYNLTANKAGEYVVIITGINSNCSEEQTFTLIINDTPTAQSDFFKPEEDAQNYALKILDNDDFGDDEGKGLVTLASEKSVQNATITLNDNGTPNNPEDDTVLYTPIANFNGNDSFQYTITDASGDTSTTTVKLYVKAVNDLPTSKNDAVTIDEDSSEISINVTENDDFGGDGPNNGKIILTNSLSNKKGSISIDNNGTSIDPTDDKINYTPLAGFNGTDTFIYKIQDKNGDKSTATVTVTVNSVNDLPIAKADTVTIIEDSSSNNIDVLDNDNYGDDGANTGAIGLVSTTSTKNGTLSVNDNNTANDPSDDAITYTPLANFNGEDSFEYFITDADGDVSTTQVTITVTDVNDNPSSSADTITVNEDSTSNTINVLENDDFGGDGFGTFTINSNTSEQGGSISIDNNSTSNDPTDDKIIYSPKENFNGIDTFEYTISDANGDKTTETVTITVTAINDTPTAAEDTITVEEDSTDNSINVTNNDDFGGDGASSGTVSITSTNTTENGTITIDDNGTTTDPTDDKINYTPAANFNGTDTFEYTIIDADRDKSIAEVTITVSEVNDFPTANADAVTVDEDSKNNTFNVTDNDDFGGDGANSGAISINNSTSNEGGTISVDNNGTVSDPTDDKIIYTPVANFNGYDNFNYTITDANGDESTVEVSITVNAVNDTPTAVEDAMTVNEDSINNSIDALANDSFGGDGANGGNVTLTSTTTSQGGTVSINNNDTENNPTDDTFIYAPATNFNGIDTFEYSILDANGDISKTNVTITVTAVNDLPETFNDTASVDENSTNNSIDVLTNDSFGGDGPNNKTITLTSAKTEKGGTVSVDNNGTASDPTDDKIIYTPLSNFAGTDTFEYTITDSNNDSANEKVTITVNPTGIKYNPVSSASCFNIFSKNKLSLSDGSTTGGVAVDGQLSINGNYNIGSEDCGCFEINQTKIGLLVNGFVNYANDNSVLNITNKSQYVKIGKSKNATTWYQDPNKSFAPIRITPNSDYETNSYIQLAANSDELNVSQDNNPVFQNNILDFVSAFQNLRTNSRSLAKESSNVEIMNSENQVIEHTNLPNEISINLENSVNYLNISAEDINNVNKINFNQKPNKNLVLIINVETSATFDWDVWQQDNIESIESPYILYNFTKARDLNIIGNKAIYGTILAPYAKVDKSINKATISGQVISQEFNHEGGEIQCAIFEGFVYSPIDAEVAPISDFTINEENQCFANNLFEFTNLSNTGTETQPTSTISYSWDFGDETISTLMNPIRTYTEPGIYNVKLTATNSYGSSSKTTQIEVVGNIVADITETNSVIDEEAGSVTKEFTLNNDTDFANFTWSLEGFDTSSFDNQKIVSFIFTEEGEHTLLLTTTNNNCSENLEVPITITSDEVSTGNDGGLESESLGDAISIRYFQRKRKNISTIFKKTSANIYNKKKMVKSLAKKSSELTMLEMFPERLADGDIAHVTSPTDILDFTVADEVLSVDFSLNNKTIGVVLGVKTIDQIYNHTKATCDRLRGAEILNVKTIEIGGYRFLQQAIKQRSGVIEHAISFAITKNDIDQFYRIQTNWYVFDYEAANDVFNFQVWASEPSNTVKMVTEILANLNNSIPVEQIEKQKVPKTYVTKVTRVSNKLNLNLKSFQETEDLEIFIDEKLNETTSNLNSRYTPLNNQKEQTLQLDINDGYEYDGDVRFDGEVQDAFYHADGNWGLDYDRRYTTVNEYEVSNNLSREYKDDELPINRNVTVKAYSEYDYLSVYKSLLPGTISADYTAYKYLAFTAKGNGPTQLVLVKPSIENWSEQYRATVNLTNEEQTFYVPFESFTSTATTDKIVADDLTTVSFTYIAVDAGTNDLDMKISDVKFTKTNTSLGVDEFISPKNNEFFAYPNPSKGDVNCTIFSDTTTKAKATLFDITGKTVFEGFINLSTGKNELKFNFKAKAGVLFLKINSSEVNYGTSKIIFK